MARLTYSARKSLPKSEFALPGKRKGGKGGYPIPDKAHARNALQRVSEFGSPAQKAEVREKVHKKYPGIGKSSHLHHESERGLHERGSHESHKREHEKADMSHEEFMSLGHKD